MKAAATDPTREVVDLFSGPGGWDLAARALGLDPLGVELDEATCRVRDAAGLRTYRGDVAALDPLDFAPCWGLIGSPPCTSFSMAGHGHGRRALSVYEDAIGRWMEGKPPSTDELDEACEDPTAHLVLEPLRWTLALRPRWVALEQVEPVLPLWERMASALRGTGYQTWAGILSAERFGVPQTRRRAFLIASLDGPVAEPSATHQRYVPPKRTRAQEESLFDAPEPERIVLPEDRHLLPWVSMAEALGWAPSDRVDFPRRADTASNKAAGSVDIDGIDYRERDLRAASQPAFALTEKARSTVRFRATNERPNGAERDLDAPAPSLAFGHNAPAWVVEHGDHPPTHLDRRQTGGDGTPVLPRATTEPAPTMTAAGLAFGRDVWTHSDRPLSEDWASARPREQEPRDPDWPENRPATTVAGDPRIAQPGHKNDEASPDSPGRMEGAIRVSIAEAAVLQDFPPDYPFEAAGSKTGAFSCVGNAVPPGLAFAVLREAVPAEAEAAA